MTTPDDLAGCQRYCEELKAEVAEVYAACPHPEAVRPLTVGQLMRTRFLHVERHNMIVDRLTQRAEAAEAEVARRAPNVTPEEANELQDILRILTNSGRALIASARDLVGRYEANTAEVARLRALVKDAYAEGFEKGFGAYHEAAIDWPTSKARAALTPPEPLRCQEKHDAAQ